MQQSLTADALDCKQQRNSYAVFSLKNNNMKLETVEALIAINCRCSGCFWHTRITLHHTFNHRINQDCAIKRFRGRRGHHRAFKTNLWQPLIPWQNQTEDLPQTPKCFLLIVPQIPPLPEFTSSNSLSRFTNILCYSPCRSALLKPSDFIVFSSHQVTFTMLLISSLCSFL